LTCENRCSTDEERDDDDKKAKYAERVSTRYRRFAGTDECQINEPCNRQDSKREITGAIEIESSSRIIAPIISGTQPKR